MSKSAQKPRKIFARKWWAERLTIATMLSGAIMVCQPFLHVLFRWGFLVTLVGIVAFTIAAHLPEDDASDG